MYDEDLERLVQRHGVPPLVPSSHPQKTLYAMRLLAACPNMSIRSQLTHSLYKVLLLIVTITSHDPLRPTGVKERN